MIQLVKPMVQYVGMLLASLNLWWLILIMIVV